MGTLYDMSTTDASNTAFAGITQAENAMLPSNVNNDFRAHDGAVARWLGDVGAVNTVAGTGDVITVTLAQPFTGYYVSGSTTALIQSGALIRFIASAANTTNVTINVNTIGAKAIRKTSGGTDVALVAGDLVAGETYTMIYRATANAAAGAWVLIGAAAIAAATTSASGIVELATVAEALTGTDAVRAVTPAGLYYPTGHLSGLGLTNSGADSIVIAAGTARDSTDTANIALAASLTKSVATAWAVGSAQGGLDTGAVGNVDYFLWLIKRPDTNVVDALFSTSGTAPTMPTNYTLKALIGKLTRVSATNQAPRSYADDRLGPTAWVAYTPTFTGFGTAVSINIQSRRNGGSLQIRGRFTAGTPTATEARITLGYAGANGNVTSNGTFVGALQVAGPATYTSATSQVYYMLIGSALGYLNISIQNASNASLTAANGNLAMGAGDSLSFSVDVPIAGW